MVWTRARHVPMHHAAALRWQGARRPCGGGRPCGGVGGPAGRPCGGEGRPGCLGHCWAAGDPLLVPRRDGVEFVGSSGKTNGWDASTSAKSERDGDGVWMTKALGLWREVGHVATSGLANVIAAAESQLVKVCASLAEAQGSIPLSLTSFYFSKLKHRY